MTVPLESVPYRKFLNVLSVLLWVPVWLVRFAFILVGLVVVPFTNPETNRIWGNYEDPVPRHWFKPYSSEFVRDYLWRAIRNPANNLRYLIKQPAFFDSVAGRDDPDDDIYNQMRTTSWRWTRSGLFSEFWYMREIGEKIFEVRLGWKFSGVPGFMITAQVRYGD